MVQNHEICILEKKSMVALGHAPPVNLGKKFLRISCLRKIADLNLHFVC